MEQSFEDQQEDRGKYNLSKRELEDIKSRLSMERNAWDDERMRCQEDLQFEESQVQAVRIEYQNALDQRKRLEKQHSESALRAKELAQELANTETETMRAAEQWQGVHDASEFAKVEVRSHEEACEQRLEGAKLEILKLQTEDAKLQERRERDVRDLRNRLRTQVLRQEDAVQRLERSFKDDQATQEQKIRQSEARTSKLETDVQVTRKTLQSLPSKTAAIEAENVELLARCEEAEERLRQADEVDRRRRAELSRLRSTLAELQRAEEFDWELAQMPEAWHMSPGALASSPELTAPSANFAMPTLPQVL